ncbi:hypothetical protein QEG73_03715 [Chitinophagaceae bacterium 26-R-25]|nr:hypothetical protein [Chitinophagaceae bacterium 26-R-25]
MSKQKKNHTKLPSSELIEKFEMLYPMVNSDLNEIRELSKKKQDDPLNKFKVGTINKKLDQVKTLLINEPTVDFLELLDEDTLPTNSDAVLLISQFVNALSLFKSKYYTNDNPEFEIESFTWKTKE